MGQFSKDISASKMFPQSVFVAFISLVGIGKFAICDLRTSIMTLGKIQIGRDNFLVSATVESEFIIVESYYGHFSSQLKL